MDAIERPIKNHKNPLLRMKEIMKAHMLFTEQKRGLLFAITAESINFNDDMLRKRILDVISRYRSKIKQILSEAARKEGKPEKIIAKMVEGRLRNFYAQRCLAEQPFVKDDKLTVGKVARQAGMKIVRFVLWELAKE